VRRDRRRGRLKPEVDINLTSLIDVVFILLIAFMVVAPALKHGLQVELAKTEGGESLTPERPVQITITVDAGEPEYFLDGDRVRADRLRGRLEARLNLAGDDMAVMIEPDADVPTGATLQVMGIILDLGITNYAFVTEPAEED
jgi:biopolymer transport protein ExbD